MKRDHQQHPEPLAERVGVDEPLQLRDEGLAEAELELRAQKLLERAHVELLEAPDVCLCELLVPNIDERRAPPERERALEEPNLLGGRLPAATRQQPLEARRVHLRRRDHEDVPAAAGLEQVAAHRPS